MRLPVSICRYVVSVLLIWACQGGPLTAAAQIVPQTFQFEDGGEALFYTFDIDSLVIQSQSRSQHPDRLLFVLAGSGCQSMGRFLPDYFRGLASDIDRTRIVILHKRHIAADADGLQCSDAFVRADHLSQWQADQLAFIQNQLQHLQQDGVMPHQRILLGISEGAELAPLLAQHLPVTHVALLSHSGIAPLALYRELSTRYRHMQAGWQGLQLALSSTPDDPDALRIHGRSWRYWSEIAQVNPMANLLALSIPLLMAVGEADPLIPPHAMSDVQKNFDDAGKSNLVLRRFPDADHGLRSANHHYLPDFMHQLDRWLDDTVVIPRK